MASEALSSEHSQSRTLLQLREVLVWYARVLPLSGRTFHLGTTVMRSRAFLLVLLFSLVAAAYAPDPKIEKIARPTSSPVSDAMWQVLDPDGWRVLLDDGPFCEIWLRKSVPVSTTKRSEEPLFPQLAPSTLLGVVNFLKSSTDYKGDPIKPGFYTLRYELLPADGNHLGVAPNPDFVLTLPPASDSDPNAQLKFADMVSLSRKATGGQHPGPLSLVQPDKTVPGISKDDQDHWIFSANVILSSGEKLPIGLVVKGTAPQ
jgi:hypothetical protein